MDARWIQARSCIPLLSSLSYQEPMQFLNSEGYYVSADDFTSVHHTKVFCNLSAPNYKKGNWNNNPLCCLADLIIPCCHAFWIYAGFFSPYREIFACILTGAGWCWRGHLGNQKETHKAWYYSWEPIYFYLPKLAAGKRMGWRLYARVNQNKCSQQQHHEEQIV